MTMNTVSLIYNKGQGGSRAGTIEARFEVSPVHHAIRAHTRELCPNGQTLQILSAPFSCEGNCGKRRRLLFFFIDVFTDF
jgi:hypothetical protein